MKNAIIIGLLVVMGAGLSHAEDLDTLKRQFGDSLLSAQCDSAARQDTLKAKYIISLTNLFDRVRSAGDLDKVKAVMAERNRFASEGAVPDNATPDVFPEMRAIQASYTRATRLCNATNASTIISLFARYNASLGRLQTELTKQDNLDEATAVQRERQRARELPELALAMSMRAQPAETPDANPSPTANPNTAPKYAPVENARPALDARTIFRHRSKADFELLNGTIETLKKNGLVYEDKDYRFKALPDQLVGKKYVLAPWDGCRAMCKIDGFVFLQ